MPKNCPGSAFEGQEGPRGSSGTPRQSSDLGGHVKFFRRYFCPLRRHLILRRQPCAATKHVRDDLATVEAADPGRLIHGRTERLSDAALWKALGVCRRPLDVPERFGGCAGSRLCFVAAGIVKQAQTELRGYI